MNGGADGRSGMMREIKFRGKRIESGEWSFGFIAKINVHKCGKNYEETVIVNQLKYDNSNYYVQEFIDADVVIPETVGQYTGLKDRDGVEIYEGDVVKGYSVYPTASTFESFLMGEVYYTDRGTWDCCSYILGGFNEQVEVIGNIHDNPELMEERNGKG